MSGKAFIVCGGTGTGKTTFMKKCLDKVSKSALMVYDVNAEYKQYYQWPNTSEPLPDVTDFLDVAKRVSDGVLVFEESTIFFSNRSSDETLKRILVRKRHTNITVFLLFHSLRTIPRYVYDLCNRVVLFKTNDSENLVWEKFKDKELVATFNLINNSSDPHASKIFDIY